jgi:endo-1,4-beta-xylanase
MSASSSKTLLLAVVVLGVVASACRNSPRSAGLSAGQAGVSAFSAGSTAVNGGTGGVGLGTAGTGGSQGGLAGSGVDAGMLGSAGASGAAGGASDADAGSAHTGVDAGNGHDASSRGTGCGVPTSFQWSSTGAIIAPKSDATHNLTGIKDPTLVFFNNQWNIYASTTDSSGSYNSVYLSFTDWSAAGSAPQQYLQGGVAPQVFYFAPQKLWYRVYEWPDAYSTSIDPTNPKSWSAGKTFYASEPAIVAQNKGKGDWIDFWVICDDANCYLFFSDDNGHLYRARTTVANFPNGFDTPVIALSDASAGRLFEACNVYSMKGTGQYLLLVEAFDSNSGGRRYFRSWAAPALDGSWTPLQAEYATPFASVKNVNFNGAAWTQDISHGEMLRSGYDQKLEIDTCHLQYLYQGKDPNASGGYNTLPWRLGLLTQTK